MAETTDTDGGFSLLAPTPGATLPLTDAITLKWTADADAPFKTFSVMLGEETRPEVLNEWFVYPSNALTVSEGSGTIDASYFATLTKSEIYTMHIYALTPSISTGTRTYLETKSTVPWTYDDYIADPITSFYLARTIASASATTTSILEGESTMSVPPDTDSTGEGGLGRAAKVGIGVGVSIAVLAIVGGLFFFFSSFSVQRKRKRGAEVRPSEEEDQADERKNPNRLDGSSIAEVEGVQQITRRLELDGTQMNVTELEVIMRRSPGHELEGGQNEINEALGVEQRQRGHQPQSWQPEISEVEAVQYRGQAFELEGRWAEIAEAPNSPRNG